MKVESVCVFCGASNNVSQVYIDEARRVGAEIAKRGMKLIYGGGDCGLMGATANAAMENNGYVIGIFPTVLLGMEAEHHGLSEHHVVGTMHARKQMMFDNSDSFVILPGGFGTMDETFEVITWAALHMHQKPIIIYNHNGYWDKWVALVNQFRDEGFASERTCSMFKVANSFDEVFELLGK